MPQTVRVLTHQQAKAFYDWMGTKQDLQALRIAPSHPLANDIC
jgi:hypothetical protein